MSSENPAQKDEPQPADLGMPAASNNPAPAKKKPITIATLGDIFVERYLWPDRDGQVQDGVMPYTVPDELRLCESTNTFVELSGSPLHAKIYRAFLKECGFVEGTVNADFQIDSSPTDDDLTSVACRLLGKASDEAADEQVIEQLKKSFSLDASFGPFPIYLHELGQIPIGKGGVRDYVWRITKSRGEIRSASAADAVKNRIPESLKELEKQTRRWLQKQQENADPMVAVICDRNAVKSGLPESSARKVFANVVQDAQALLKVKDKALLILWHTRSPLLDKEDKLAQFFLNDAAHCTIPIISDACLRQEGVTLRFDVSFEASIRDFLSSSNADIIRKLQSFPHVLIRFEYGILHLTSQQGKLVGMDVHSIAEGNIFASKGIVEGMTPLLVASLLREIVAMHVAESTDNAIERFQAKSKAYLHPTMLNNTPIDRAIDIALLLWARHFRQGYGDGTTGVRLARSEYSTERAFGELAGSLAQKVVNLRSAHNRPAKENEAEQVASAIKELVGKHDADITSNERTACLTAKALECERIFLSGSGAAEALSELVLVQDGPETDVLTRFSVDEKDVETIVHLERRKLSDARGDQTQAACNEQIQAILENNSRTNLLRDPRMMSLAAGVPTLNEALVKGDHEGKHLSLGASLNDDAKKATGQAVYDSYSKLLADERVVRGRVLERIVKQGLEYVLQRPEFLSEIKKGVFQAYRFEPSITCPCVRLGDLTTVSSHEIDSFLAIRYLVQKYINDPDWNRPLPLAVFGKPGSGKNSTITKVLASVPGCVIDPALQCNLAQWSNIESLSKHFHKIQDRTLHSDKPPVVVFDEFDARLGEQSVGWLKYFLMPLQDGMYMVGNDTFHIGRSIFVFAGGVAHSFEDFNRQFAGKEDAKVMDFVSRLRGHIDIKDIAYSDSFDPEETLTIADHSAQIRRAVLLRGILNRNMKGIFDKANQVADVASALIYAFLNIPTFKHGVRSMEAIVQMSRVSSGTASYQPSALPTKEQLGLHVDAEEFMRLVRSQAGSSR
jgi:hypothetical protein